ncbi:unnamed protein product [Diatraea saccharalis]|uniref:XK-related protein n=1 Tax=Diatraea saccharalis TaxID=40085 RepID=A0A9N9RB14_9NEOP|nr:unnamed protein product [Diatraea saccharalis]
MAYLFPYWTILACGIHILVMAAWIQIFEHPTFCSHNRIAEYAFSLALGAVYLFTYILSVEARTRYRYAIYYTTCLLQNITCGALWFVYATNDLINTVYFLPLLLLTVIPYVIGLIIMVVYYLFFHPRARKCGRDIIVSFKAGDQLSEIR